MAQAASRTVLALVALAGVFPAACPAANGARLPLFQNLSVDDGLPENSSWGLVQDRLGFLWIATQNGLVRYDGYRFVTFKPNPSVSGGIRGRSIFALTEGSGNAIWVATEWGLEKLDRLSGRFTVHPAEFTDPFAGRVVRLHESRDGCVWILTGNGLLSRLDPRTDRMVVFRHDPRDPRSLAHTEVTRETCFLETGSGDIWVGTQGGLHRFEPSSGSFTRVPVGQGNQAMEAITCLGESVSAPGMIWVGTGSGRFLKVSGRAEAGRPAVLEEHRLPRPRENAPPIYVTGILEDPGRGVWLASSGGLFLLEAAGRVREALAPDPGGDDFSAFTGPLVRDMAGRLWFRSLDRKALLLFEPGTGRLNRLAGDPADPSGFRSGSGIFDLLLDRGGVLWVGTWLGGLNRMDLAGESFTGFRHDPARPDSLSHDTVRAVLARPDGRLWVGTERGLDRLDPATGRCVHSPAGAGGPDSPGERTIRSLCTLQDGTLWIGTNQGLDRLDPVTGRITLHLAENRGAPDPAFLRQVAGLAASPGPVAAILGAGDNLDATRPFSLARETTVLVVCVGERFSSLTDFGWIENDKGQVRWHFDAGASRHAGGAGRNRIDARLCTLPPGGYRLRYRSNASHSAAGWADTPPDHPGWWGIQVLPLDNAAGEALRRFPPGQEDQGLSGGVVRALLEDFNGKIWIGTTNGLDRYDPATGRVRHFRNELDNPFSLSDNTVTVFLQDRAGRLWVGTNDGGVNLYDPQTESFRHYLPRRCILSLFEDSAGRFWVGTYEEGLYLLDRANGTWRAFSEREGLSNDLVSGIREDGQGFLWLATMRGLSRLDPRTGVFRRFDVTDGVVLNNRLSALIRCPDGSLCAVGNRGLSLFNPSRMRNNPYPPEVVLTGFRLFGKAVDPSPSGPLDVDITVADEIRLSWEQNSFAFEFAALHFSAPARNRCRYRLEGFDRGWVEAGPEHLANYTNLDPGTYLFRVQGCNGDGVWNLAGRSIRVVISPPFWRTPVAYALYLAGAALLVVGAHHLRVWRLKRSEALLKRQVALKTVELSHANTRLSRANESLEKTMADLSDSNAALEKANEARGELLRMAAHDLKNPLTAIVGFTKLLRPKLSGEPKNLEKLSIISESANRMHQLIAELLETAAIEDGRLVLNRVVLDAGDLVAGAVVDARPAAEQKGQTLHFSDAGGCRVEVDPGILRQVMDNLIGNAVKFSPPGKSIWVSVEQGEGEVRLGVRDEGPGLTEEDKRMAFGKFQKLSARPTGGESSSGLGLSIVKGLVELHGGRIGVESEEGRGALFRVTLPAAP